MISSTLDYKTHGLENTLLMNSVTVLFSCHLHRRPPDSYRKLIELLQVLPMTSKAVFHFLNYSAIRVKIGILPLASNVLNLPESVLYKIKTKVLQSIDLLLPRFSSKQQSPPSLKFTKVSRHKVPHKNPHKGWVTILINLQVQGLLFWRRVKSCSPVKQLKCLRYSCITKPGIL